MEKKNVCPTSPETFYVKSSHVLTQQSLFTNKSSFFLTLSFSISLSPLQTHISSSLFPIWLSLPLSLTHTLALSLSQTHLSLSLLFLAFLFSSLSFYQSLKFSYQNVPFPSVTLTFALFCFYSLFLSLFVFLVSLSLFSFSLSSILSHYVSHSLFVCSFMLLLHALSFKTWHTLSVEIFQFGTMFVFHCWEILFRFLLERN